MDMAENISSGAPRAPDMKGKFYAVAGAVRVATVGRYIIAGYDAQDMWTSGHYVLESPEEQRHPWHVLLQDSAAVHAAVLDVLNDDYLPTDLDKLVMEWPTVSSDGRLAYTQSVAKGRDVTRTVTTPGRFITRHWPKLPTDYIRDVVARNTAKVEVWHDAGEIVRAVREGPHSCMSGDGGGESEHPYLTYAPQYGWRIAVRLQGAREIWARALLLMPSRGPYVEGETLEGAEFVRTYKKCQHGSYSHTDEALHAWLEQRNAKKVDGWPCGTKLARIERTRRGHGNSAGSPFVAPYIDGRDQRVDDMGSHLVLDSDGAYKCDSTDGTAENQEDDCSECSNCGDMSDTDDGIFVGTHGHEYIGDCCSEYYEMGYGEGCRRYYFPRDNAVSVGGTWYHESWLKDNGIVELDNGEHASMGDAFCCAVDNCWYLSDDGASTEDEGMVHVDNAWRCAVTGRWYSTSVPCANSPDGETVHPDTLTGSSAFMGPPQAGPAVPVDPDRVFEGIPPSDGWWNVMYARPIHFEESQNEWSRVESGVLTHRVHAQSSRPSGLPAHWAQTAGSTRPVPSLYRHRHPTWAVEAERLIASATATVAPLPEDAFAAVRAAFAAGAAIQYRPPNTSAWSHVYRNNPGWYDCTDYRVDPAQEYTHGRMCGSGTRYRAGTTDIDVWGMHGLHQWAQGAVGPNACLTIAAGFIPVPGHIADTQGWPQGAFVPVSDYSMETT